MHNACRFTARVAVMPNLQIRDLPQEIYDALKIDAEMEQRSLTQQAIVTLRQAQQKRGTDRRAAAVEILRQSGRRFNFDDQLPEHAIREDRQR